jgi:hypothetical protein
MITSWAGILEYAAALWQPGADSSEPTLGFGPAATGPLPPVPAPVKPKDRQSGVITPRAPSVPQHTLSEPRTRQRLA